MIKIQSRTKNAPTKIRDTARNKIRNLTKMINKTTKEKAKEYFEERLKLWRTK